MTTATQAELATFAARQNLTPAEATTLPALFTRAAEAAGVAERSMISQATYTNPELGSYLASVARKVSAQRASAA